jgi:hypothetical protein
VCACAFKVGGTQDANLNERHGSLTGVAEVTLGLAELQIFDDSANTQLTEVSFPRACSSFFLN